MFVADGGTLEIHAFDIATGHRVATAGREGVGPGEFRWLQWIGDCGRDSIFASDAVQNRVSVYSLDLDHLRTFSIDVPPSGGLMALQCAGASAFVGINNHADPLLDRDGGGLPPVGEAYRSTFDLVLFAQDGSYRQAIGPFPGWERYRSPGADPNRYSDVPLLWGLTPVLASSDWGFVVGTNDSWSLVSYDPDGNPLDTLKVAESRVAVTRSHRAAYVQRRVQRSEGAGRPIASTRRYWAEYPYPSSFPAYSKVVALASGFVWVEQFAAHYLEQQAPHWKVFAPDGTFTATVDLPERFQLLWANETHVAGIMLNALDVQTVELRPIQATSSQEPPSSPSLPPMPSSPKG